MNLTLTLVLWEVEVASFVNGPLRHAASGANCRDMRNIPQNREQIALCVPEGAAIAKDYEFPIVVVAVAASIVLCFLYCPFVRHGQQ